jgi:hypothetical protein
MRDEKRTTPMGLYTLGEEFHEAYMELSSISSISVKYYLLCHALELYLKSFIYSEGTSLKKVIEKGHSFEKLLKSIDAKKIALFFYQKKIELFLKCYIHIIAERSLNIGLQVLKDILV